MIEDILLAAIASFLLGMAGGYPCCCDVFVGSFGSSPPIPPLPPIPPGSTSTSTEPPIPPPESSTSTQITLVPCDECLNNELPEFWQIDFDNGWTGDPCGGPTCDQFFGDQVFIVGPFADEGPNCRGAITEDVTPCNCDPDDTGTFDLSMNIVGGSISVTAGGACTGAATIFRVTTADPTDCLASYDVPWFSNQGFATCFASLGMEAHVSPVPSP